MNEISIANVVGNIDELSNKLYNGARGGKLRVGANELIDVREIGFVIHQFSLVLSAIRTQIGVLNDNRDMAVKFGNTQEAYYSEKARRMLLGIANAMTKGDGCNSTIV